MSPLFFLLLPVACNAVVPLFGECKNNDLCEGTAICRFHICLPPTKPVPIIIATKPPVMVPRVPEPKPLPRAPQPQPARPQTIPRKVLITNPRPSAPVPTAVQIECKPNCVGAATCVKGKCLCSRGLTYSLIAGCVVSSRPMMAIPVPPARVVPQALPGDKCDPGTECSGGSVCSLGICTCPPELVHQGGVCVTSSVVGLPFRGLPGYTNVFF